MTDDNRPWRFSLVHQHGELTKENAALRARIAELTAALDVAANYLERVYTSDIWEADYKRYAEAARAALEKKE